MKQIILNIAAVALLALPLQAQVDRSKAPAPGVAPTIQLGDFSTFELSNGLKVIVVENHKRPTLSLQLSIDRDPSLENENAGFIGLAGQLLSTGTTNRTKAQLDEEIDFLGASLSTGSSGIYASTLVKHTDKMMGLMTDVLFNPAFDADQLEKLKKQTISGLSANKEDANAIANNVSNVLNYGKKHPYGEIETEESIETITVDMCKEFYNTYFKPNVSYLVIVGDITTENAKTLAQTYFGKWVSGAVASRTYQLPKAPNGNHLAFVAKESAVQSVINVTYPINLKPGTTDVIAAKVMNSILGGGVFSGRLMQNLREDKAFTYGARSSIGTDKLVAEFSAGASVRNEVTDSSITEFLFELRRIATEKVDEADLQLVKNSMNGSFARSLESPQTIANFALNMERYDLPEDYYATYLQKLNAVTVDDVLAVAKKYIKPDNANIVVVGNIEEADKLAAFDSKGKVNYYDIYGKKTEAVNLKPVPEGVTKDKVLENYVIAITQSANLKKASKKLKKVKDLTVKSSIAVQGMELEMVSYQKAPNKYAMELKIGEMVAQRQAFNGTTGFSTSMQTGTKDLEGEMLEQIKRQATMNAELKLEELGFKTVLLGMEVGKEASYYVLEHTGPDGNKVKEYYDTISGLKFKTSSKVNNPDLGGEINTVNTYADYKDVQGILYPHAGSISGGPQSVDFKVVSIEVNTKLGDGLFEK
jgi:zinc protease